MTGRTTDESRRLAKRLAEEISRLAVRPIRLMEVCGSHTVAIFKAGLRQLLPAQVELVSGPGCPVCVTPNEYLDTAVAYSRQPGVIIATFGDMLRVPGSSSSLAAAKMAGADIRIIYSPLESLDIAAANPTKTVIFLAVGFETTAPTAAATILAAEQAGLANWFALSAHKLVPPALRALLEAGGTRIDGLILPGHVSAVIGEAPYRFLAEEYRMPAVIAGFEPLEILQAVHSLARWLRLGEPRLANQYRRVVKPEGNPVARAVLGRVYGEADAAWRGLGVIPASGLVVRKEYQRFDARRKIPVEPEAAREPDGCRCGEVLRGMISPEACLLFRQACRPENPVGSCMVSAEGACAAWYKYGSGRWQG
ncbi:MAG TPA: hydrogenase formation protein HypD [Selenomonadales bacterium]|nr:hydrogenase formation protein HypD [Selenomonadales bacterium]